MCAENAAVRRGHARHQYGERSRRTWTASDDQRQIGHRLRLDTSALRGVFAVDLRRLGLHLDVLGHRPDFQLRVETGLFVKRDPESAPGVALKPVGRDFQLVVSRRQVEKAVVAAGIGRGLELYAGIDGYQCDGGLRDRAPALVSDHAVERGADVLRRRDPVKKRQIQHNSQEVSLSYACHFRLLGGWCTVEVLPYMGDPFGLYRNNPVRESAFRKRFFICRKSAARATACLRARRRVSQVCTPRLKFSTMYSQARSVNAMMEIVVVLSVTNGKTPASQT